MVSIITLPNETLLQIISYLTHIHYLHVLSLTCRRLHDLADNSLHLLAARRHPYLLCWACGTSNIRLVERLLDAGVDPNRPFRLETDGRIGWSKELIDSPLEALDTVYGHSLWTAAYYNAEKRVSLDGHENDASVNSPGNTEEDTDDSDDSEVIPQWCCEEDQLLFSRLPIKTRSSQFEPQTYFDQLLSLDKAYDPRLHIDLYDYWNTACYWFPLHTAVMIGCDSIVRLLLVHGAHINAPSFGLCDCYHCFLAVIPRAVGEEDYQPLYGDLRGYPNPILLFNASTPIHIAVCHSRQSMVTCLITLGSTIVIDLDHPKSTAFHLAASRGSLSTMQLLLDKQLVDIDAQDHLGVTPLLHAHGKHHSIGTIRWLLDHGADVNYSLDPECKPLHIACYYGWYREAIELINAGASIDAPYGHELYQGRNFVVSDYVLPITLACMDDTMGPYRDKHKRHVSNRESYRGYKEAVEREAVQLVKRMLDAGLNNRQYTYELQKALTAATSAHRPWLMELLVQAGASVTGVTQMHKYGGREFPLIAAVLSDTPLCRDTRPIEIIAWLLERGADVKQVTIYGQTVFNSINERLDHDMVDSITTFLREKAEPQT